jgi:hypothetical protein
MQQSTPITTADSISDGRMKNSVYSSKKKLLKMAVKNGKGGPGGLSSIGYGVKKAGFSIKSSFSGKGKSKKAKGISVPSSSSLLKSLLKDKKASSFKIKITRFKSPKLKSIKLKKLRKSIKSAF